MAILLTCPGCQRQMTIPDESRGATVRCPACNTLFASTRDPYGNALPQSVAQASVPPSPLAGPGYVEVVDRGRPPVQPANRGRLDNDDPLSMQRPPGPDPLTTFALLGGLAMLAVVVLVFAAFIWPGFLRRNDGFAQQGPHDLLSLAPENSVLLCGTNLPDDAMDRKVLDMLDQAGTPPVLKDVVADAQRVMLAGEYSNHGPTGLLAVLTKSPYDRKKIETGFGLGQERLVDGTSIYTMKIADNPFGVKEAHVAMPDARVLVVGVMPEADFVKALANQGKTPVVASDLTARVREIETGMFWLLLANRGSLHGLIKAQNQFLANLLFGDQAAVLGPTLPRCKSLSFVDRAVDRDHRLELALECANPADAIKLHEFLEARRQEWKRNANKEPLDPALGPALADVLRTFTLETRGAKVVGTAEITEKAVKDAEKVKLPAAEKAKLPAKKR